MRQAADASSRQAIPRALIKLVTATGIVCASREWVRLSAKMNSFQQARKMNTADEAIPGIASGNTI